MTFRFPDRFPRGTGPLVSVLLPTRKRHHLLRESLLSLFTNAENPADIEVLLKVDDDDLESITVAERVYRDYPYIHCWDTPRGDGYWNMTTWLNLLALQAHGDWLYVFNDDAKMTTKNWEAFIRNARPPTPAARAGIFGYITPVRDVPESRQFLVVRRKVCELLGHLTMIPSSDTWLATILAMVESIHYSDITVEHVGNTLDDEVVRDRLKYDLTIMSATIVSATLMRKVADCLKLQAVIDEQLWLEGEAHIKETCKND